MSHYRLSGWRIVRLSLLVSAVGFFVAGCGSNGAGTINGQWLITGITCNGQPAGSNSGNYSNYLSIYNNSATYVNTVTSDGGIPALRLKP